VLWKPSRGSRAGRSPLRTGSRGRALRNGASWLIVLSLVFLAGGCGRNVQTSQPYTPGEGVNVDVGDPANPQQVVHVRNLTIISWARGEGVVSGSIVTADRDSLTAVTGIPIKADGSEGAPFTGTIPATVTVANGVQVVLTDQPPIIVKSPDIAAGFDAVVTLQFANAGEITTRAPIVDGNVDQYVSLKPSATPSV
jgi:hypothetical protein